MLSILQDTKHIIDHEVFNCNETVNSERYSYKQEVLHQSLLTKLSLSDLSEKYNTAHCKTYTEKHSGLEYKILPRPPWSPNITSAD